MSTITDGTDGGDAWAARSGSGHASSDVATPWFDYLFTSVRELERLIEGTGWTLDDVIDGAGPTYAFVLRKG